MLQLPVKISHQDQLHTLWDFLNRVDQGHTPSREEQSVLDSITHVSGMVLEEIPHSIHLLHNLFCLTLVYSPITDCSPLSQLTSLKELILPGTDIADCSPLASLTALTRLSLNHTSIRDCSPLASLSALTELDLSGTPIRDCSPLAFLSALTQLDLSDTQIRDCSPLASLSALTELDLSDTQIRDCSPLASLSALTELDLSGTQIRDCNPLQHLSALENLFLTGTPLSNFTPLAELTNLTNLWLSNTDFACCDILQNMENLSLLNLNKTKTRDCRALSGLKNLTCLYLGHTNIEDCSFLSNLNHIESLNLEYTNIKSCPILGAFDSLRKLNLAGLQLHSICRELVDAGLPFVDEEEYYQTGINLHNVQLRTQPVSLFFQPREMIRKYFESPQVPIQEAKVIFLGDGGAGKTHTIKRILNDCKNEAYETETTPGIEISPYDANCDGKPLHINFWDFGGQEIMHAMHRCFLTERSLYVVILSNRYDLMPRARYWLKNIQSFAKNSPVLLAVNRWDNISTNSPDMGRLQTEYPQLLPVPLYYYAKDPSEEEFRYLFRSILKEATKLDSTAMTFPKDWAEIRRELLNKAESSHYISMEDYYKLCQDRNLQDPRIRHWLLSWFNDMGICFSYHGQGVKNSPLEEYKVLQPKWLTNAIYILINNGRSYADKGKILLQNIRDLLEHPLKDPKKAVLPYVTYKDEEFRYILEVMRKFNLSYNVDERHEFIPALCDDQTPTNLHPQHYGKKLSYIMKYAYLPDTVIHRLMIRCYRKLHPDYIWRKGLRLEEDLSELIAVVDMGNDDATLRIDIYARGDTPPWKLLNKLRNTLTDINKDIGLQAEDHILIQEGSQEIPYPVRDLLDAKKEGLSILPIHCKESGWKKFNVDELLGETFGKDLLRTAEAVAKEENQPITQIFYSIHAGDVYYQYGMDDSSVIRLLEVLATQQAQSQELLADSIIRALEASGDPNDRKEAETMKQDKAEKRDVLGGLAKRMKQISDIGGGVGKLITAGKVGYSVFEAVKPWLAENLPKLPELAQKVPEVVKHIHNIF